MERLFARRAINQVKVILDLWQKINEKGWNRTRHQALQNSNAKLKRYAQHFDMVGHLKLADQIQNMLGAVDKSSTGPTSEFITDMSELMHQLSNTTIQSAEADPSSLTKPNKPIYVALSDTNQATHLAEQLQQFGYRPVVVNDDDELIERIEDRYPAAIIAGVDFGFGGIPLLTDIKLELKLSIPVIFYTPEENPDIETRVLALRAGGEFLQTGKFDFVELVEELDGLTSFDPINPYRVMIVDDSRTQSMHIQSVLNAAGMITRVVNNPADLLEQMASFETEVIIMDMYMPGYTGMELAKVIRQNEETVNIPIIYLSAEESLDVQVEAMVNGGDEFLTKPIKPKHLTTIIKARVDRARSLAEFMFRDSLTGLYNHTKSLSILEAEIERATYNKTPLCFAMVDIDHFKQVNDTYGHPIGDRVIKNLALLLSQRLRKSDSIGRYGGEEFAVIMPATTADEAVATLDELRQRFAQLAQPTGNGNDEFFSSFSCGVCELSPDNAELIGTYADEALYQAKRGGRNRVCLYNDDEASK